MHVAASLNALGDHDFGTAFGGLDSRGDVTDLDEHYGAALARSSDQLAIDPPGEGDVARALVEHHFEPLSLIKGQHQVHAIVHSSG